MIQTIIQVGNSLAVTLSKDTIRQIGWKKGQKIYVDEDVVNKSVTISAKPAVTDGLNKDYFAWKQQFMKNNAGLMKSLAKTAAK